MGYAGKGRPLDLRLTGLGRLGLELLAAVGIVVAFAFALGVVVSVVVANVDMKDLGGSRAGSMSCCTPFPLCVAVYTRWDG